MALLGLRYETDEIYEQEEEVEGGRSRGGHATNQWLSSPPACLRGKDL